LLSPTPALVFLEEVVIFILWSYELGSDKICLYFQPLYVSIIIQLFCKRHGKPGFLLHFFGFFLLKNVFTFAYVYEIALPYVFS